MLIDPIKRESEPLRNLLGVQPGCLRALPRDEPLGVDRLDHTSHYGFAQALGELVDRSWIELVSPGLLLGGAETHRTDS